MTKQEMLERRWTALIPPTSLGLSPEAVVARLGAVQAQDAAMAALAVALRTGGTTESVREALDAGAILRTHVLRPTWHLVARDDLRWLAELTHPGVLKAARPELKRWGLSEEILTRSREALAAALADGPVSRDVLASALTEAGVRTPTQPLPLYLIDAEQHSVITSGPRVAGEATYDLVDRRVPAQPPLPRDEAVARLCVRHLAGHGPATVRDLAWWSGLGLTELRKGLEASRPRLTSAEFEGELYWFDPNLEPKPVPEWLWLPAFDESLMGFADRSLVLSPAHADRVATKNGIFRPVVVHWGQVVGIWSSKAGQVAVDWFEQAPDGADAARAEWEAQLQKV